MQHAVVHSRILDVARRRITLGFMATLLAGLGIGVGGGFGLRLALASPVGDGRADATLLQLEAMACGDLDTLLASANDYLMHLDVLYPDNDVLWRGAHRVGCEVIADAQMIDRRLRARMLLLMARTHARPEFDSKELEALQEICGATDKEFPFRGYDKNVVLLVREVRRLARAPDAELLLSITTFIGGARDAVSWGLDDELIRKGIQRAAAMLASTPDIERRALLAKLLLQICERCPGSLGDLEHIIRKISRR